MKWSAGTRQLIDVAIDEDLKNGTDLSSALLRRPDEPVAARITARQAGTVSGLVLAGEICAAFSSRPRTTVAFESTSVRDGDAVERSAVLGLLRGPRTAVLTAERTVLNFLTRMSGVATVTRRFVDAAAAVNPACRILDTRKTLPGWRELDKYAVRCGGGENHRMGLYDAVLIKDNHIAGIAAGALADALRGMIAALGPGRGGAKFVEVEVDRLEQLAAVLEVEGVEMVLLDNFTPVRMREAVAMRDGRGLRGRVLLEASGGVRIETVAEIAGTGVDRISIGALTHSAPAMDIGLDLEPTG